MPELFYDFYRWHNGSCTTAYGHRPLHQGQIVLPLGRILKDKKMWDGLEDEDTFTGYEPGTWWNKAWIPFLYAEDWWVGVIDTAGCFGGEPGQILSFDFKSGDDKYVEYASFEKWLETMLEFKKASVLQFDNEEDSYKVPDGKITQQIVQQVNGDFPFFVETWKYRRKEKPENPNWQALEDAILQHDLARVQALITEQKIDVSEQNLYIAEKFTPLLLALKHQSFEIALWLIEQGANLTYRDCHGRDAFSMIVEGYHAEITPTIINLIRSMLAQGYTSKETSTSNFHFLTRLATQAVRYGDVALMSFCLAEGVDINSPISQYSPDSFLHEVASSGKHFEMADFLVNQGIDKSLANRDGKTALALYREKFEAIQTFLRHYPDWINSLSEA